MEEGDCVCVESDLMGDYTKLKFAWLMEFKIDRFSKMGIYSV